MPRSTTFHSLLYSPKARRKTTITILNQVLHVLKGVDIRQIALEINADKETKKFTSIEHLTALYLRPFGQFAYLREFVVLLEYFQGDLHQISLSYGPGHSTIACANEHRPWQFIERVFYNTLNFFHRAVANPLGALRRKFSFNSNIYSINSTTIVLCHSMYDLG
jgi:hypothetical protein